MHGLLAELADALRDATTWSHNDLHSPDEADALCGIPRLCICLLFESWAPESTVEVVWFSFDFRVCFFGMMLDIDSLFDLLY